MSLRYLVDTDLAIHYMNGQPEIVRRLEELLPAGIGLSVVSLAELWEGVHYSRDPAGSEQGLRDSLRCVSIVPIDDDVCRRCGKERGRLRAINRLIGDFDLLIGSTASARRCASYKQPTALRDDRGTAVDLAVALLPPTAPMLAASCE